MKCNIAEVQFSSPHHEVLALGGAVLYGHAVGVPSKLRGNDIAVPQHRIAALPQGLDAVELGVLDGDMVRVPQGRPALICQLAVPMVRPWSCQKG